MSGAERIKSVITACPRGSIFFPEEFFFAGGPKLVGSALERLCKDNVIIRVAQGIYCYPEIDTQWGMGALYPSVEDIARAISKRDKCRIAPTGAYAMNVLGLSTQLQANVVYYTDGSSRRVNVGNGRGILFKRSSNMRIFAFNNNLMQLIVAALKEISNGKVTAEDESIIASRLKEISEIDFIHDLYLAPVWIQTLLKKLR